MGLDALWHCLPRILDVSQSGKREETKLKQGWYMNLGELYPKLAEQFAPAEIDTHTTDALWFWFWMWDKSFATSKYATFQVGWFAATPLSGQKRLAGKNDK